MAQTSWPFESIDTNETQYSQLFRNFGAGVVGSPTGTQLGTTAGSGLEVNVAAGQCMVRGHYYSNTATESLTVETANPTNPRIDTVVLRLDPAANSIILAVVTGTPASSPVAPTLTQTDAGIFEFPLADVRVNATSTSITSITDRRTFIGSRFGVWTTSNRPVPAVGLIGYNTTISSPEVYDGANWVSLGAPTSINASIIETTINTQAGTGYVLVGSDAGKLIQTTSSSPVSITIPNVLTSNGQRVDVVQMGDGQITFQASGVTLNSAEGKLKTNVRYSAATIIRIASGSYVVIGDLTA